MSLNENNWRNLKFVECGDNYAINLETNEIRNDVTGRILKTSTRKGYKRLILSFNSKHKGYDVHQLVWIAHNGLYDTSKYVVDHEDRDKLNNNINNLRLASKSLNSINRSQQNGKSFEYQSELPDSYIIDEECEVYYCKTYDKFYRKVADNQYRELREYKRSNYGTRIRWSLNHKQYCFTTTNFRESII